MERSIRYKLCLRHPDKRLVVQHDQTGNQYIPWCVECWRERGDGEPQLAPDNDQARRLGVMVSDNLPAVREVMIQTTPEPITRPMTIQEFDDRMALIEHVVHQMVVQVHYGVIPGTRDKSLWEPGAEYLRAAFNIGWSYAVEEKVEDYDKSDFRYRVRAFTLNRSGSTVAEWTASAWSRERKFWCRGGENGCPRNCEQDHEPLGMERGMLPHNVLDRAIKRAFVALMRNVTGTTGYFKQALVQDDETHQEPIPPKDNRYRCPQHGVDWFKRGKMKNYAHPIGDTGEWCNMKDAKLDIPLEQAQEAPSEPASVVDTVEASALAPGDFEAVVDSLGRPTSLKALSAVAKALGYKTPESIRAVIGPASDLVDLDAAQYKLIQSSPLRPKE